MEVLAVDPQRPDPGLIARAAAVIRRGGLVAFPTETVYGLGADALDPRAVARIFAAKGRPPDNPLIVHVAGAEDAFRLATRVPPAARRLAADFWPGPLTLVLPRSDLVPPITAGGLDTVALRMPDHPVALALIRAAGCPVAAPSANLSGRPSPTTAQHVLEDMAGRVDLVVDGGPARVGVESTVIDLSREPPVLLRPGGVTLERLRAAVGGVEVDPAVWAEGVVATARAPGMKYRHYAPRAGLVLVEGPPEAAAAEAVRLVRELAAGGARVGVLAVAEDAAAFRALGPEVVVETPGSRGDLAAVATRLFDALRRLDSSGVDWIVAQGVPGTGLGLAILNRLRKAAERVVRAGP